MVAVLLSAAAGADERDSVGAEQAAAARREQIRAEVQALGSHAWAGEYYAGDGTGVNTTLLLAPDAGYVFEWHGCMGLYDRNYGSVTSSDGILRLTFAFDNVRKAFSGIAPELTAVAWGERRYLVPADGIIEFCNSVNQGDEPRADLHGRHLLRRGDESKEASGPPELPPEHRGCLLASPVEAEVTAVGESTYRGEEWKVRVTPVALDAGNDDGFRVGMELFIVRSDYHIGHVRVDEVEEDRSEATLLQFDEDDPEPEVGWRVTTRPWYMEKTRVKAAVRWLSSLL